MNGTKLLKFIFVTGCVLTQLTATTDEMNWDENRLLKTVCTILGDISVAQQSNPDNIQANELYVTLMPFAPKNTELLLNDPLDLSSLQTDDLLKLFCTIKNSEPGVQYLSPIRSFYTAVNFSDVQGLPLAFFEQFLKTFGAKIKDLNLSETDISNKHLELIERYCESLEYIDLSGCNYLKVTSEGIHTLLKRKPLCKINY